MVSKKNFQQNGRQIIQSKPNTRAGAMPYKRSLRSHGGLPSGNFNQMIFNASQIPDNPGYMDFNNPTPPTHTTIGGASQVFGQQKKKNRKPKGKLQQQQTIPQPQQQLQQNSNWNKNKNQPPPRGGQNKNRFNRNVRGGFGPMPMPGPNRGRRMMPPIGPIPRGGPLAPMPPLHGFQPPMIPPIPPMGRGPMPPMNVQPPPPYIRRSGRGGPMPMVPPMPPMIPPRVPRGMPVVPFNNAGKIKKVNPKTVKKVIKGKSTIKTLKNLINQYPLDKPWVTTEIRAEHDKKVDIENRLKGNKDDELFAQYKTQRDKFVTMYESAREEYLKNEANIVKAKETKDKQTINKTATKDGNNEAIQNKTDNA